MLKFGNQQIEVLPTRCCEEYKALILNPGGCGTQAPKGESYNQF